MTLWNMIKMFCNNNIGLLIRRKDLINFLRSHGYDIGNKYSTVDMYRNYLFKAGYLVRVRYGIYMIDKEVPMYLSVDDVRQSIYTEGKNYIINIDFPKRKKYILKKFKEKNDIWTTKNMKKEKEYEFITEEEFKV